MNAEDLRLKEQLRRAVRSEEVPPYLETRILANIRTASSRRPHWMIAAVAAAGLLGVTVAYEIGYLRITAASQEAYITSLSGRVASVLRAGLGDHLHCAYFRKFPKTPPPMQEFAAMLGSDYSRLIPIVQAQVPSRFRVEAAHKCRYHGRQFVHLALRDGKNLLSLVIATRQPGESLNESFMTASVQRFDIASFETRDHLVYFISDLPASENRQYLSALRPQLTELLGKLEL